MVIAVAAALALSARFPIGLGALAEVHAGTDLQAPILFGGAAVLALALVGSVAAAAWRATAGTPPASESSTLSSWLPNGLARIRSPLSTVNGARLALTSGRGHSALPVASTLGTLIVAIAALSASAVFGSSLDRLVTTPRLEGWAWDAHARADDSAAFGDVQRIARRVAADRAVHELAVTTGVPRLRVGRERPGTIDAAALGIDAVAGHVFPPLTRGKMPVAPDEIALPARLADRLGVGVGDRIWATGDDASAHLRVTAIAVFPATVLAASDLRGDGVLLSVAGAQHLSDEARHGGGVLVRFRPDADRAAAAARVEKAVGTLVDFRLASDVGNLNRARWTPRALSVVLAALGLATLTHLLVTAVRRRRADLAMLKTLGVTRRGIAATVASQASTLVLLSLVAGVPAGIASGRVLWSAVASGLGVVPAPAVPVPAVALAALATIVLANAIAAVPARAGARVSVVTALRAE
jgi:hypothetical protein